jgi:uncharacterized cupin superfamily protein
MMQRRYEIGTSVILGAFGTYFKVSGDSTGGAYAVVEHTLAPGSLAAPPHRHTHEDEVSYVIEGELTALLGDEVVVAQAGSYVVKPRGQWHTFWNAGTTTLWMIEIISPAGFEAYFAELGEIIQPDAPPDMDAITALIARYGLEMDMSRIPELTQKYNVELK